MSPPFFKILIRNDEDFFVLERFHLTTDCTDLHGSLKYPPSHIKLQISNFKLQTLNVSATDDTDLHRFYSYNIHQYNLHYTAILAEANYSLFNNIGLKPDAINLLKNQI